MARLSVSQDLEDISRLRISHKLETIERSVAPPKHKYGRHYPGYSALLTAADGWCGSALPLPPDSAMAP